jgi:hypothetical protein
MGAYRNSRQHIPDERRQAQTHGYEGAEEGRYQRHSHVD